MRGHTIVTIGRWIAVLPGAVLSGVVTGMIGVAAYRLLPGDTGQPWRAAGLLPAAAAPASAFLCFLAATAGFIAGRAIAPSHRRLVVLALAALLSAGTVLQAVQAWTHLARSSGSGRDSDVISLWEAAAFAVAIVVVLAVTLRRGVRTRASGSRNSPSLHPVDSYEHQ